MQLTYSETRLVLAEGLDQEFLSKVVLAALNPDELVERIRS